MAALSATGDLARHQHFVLSPAGRSSSSSASTAARRRRRAQGWWRSSRPMPPAAWRCSASRPLAPESRSLCESYINHQCRLCLYSAATFCTSLADIRRFVLPGKAMAESLDISEASAAPSGRQQLRVLRVLLDARRHSAGRRPRPPHWPGKLSESCRVEANFASLPIPACGEPRAPHQNTRRILRVDCSKAHMRHVHARVCTSSACWLHMLSGVATRHVLHSMTRAHRHAAYSDWPLLLHWHRHSLAPGQMPVSLFRKGVPEFRSEQDDKLTLTQVKMLWRRPARSTWPSCMCGAPSTTTSGPTSAPSSATSARCSAPGHCMPTCSALAGHAVCCQQKTELATFEAVFFL